MKNQIIEISLQRIAKTAGIAYLLIIILPLLSMLLIDPEIKVKGDTVATINNIIANELLYRIDSTITFIMFVGVVVLALALYRILKPVNKLLAQLALLWRFAEALVGMIAILGNFVLFEMLHQVHTISTIMLTEPASTSSLTWHSISNIEIS